LLILRLPALLVAIEIALGIVACLVTGSRNYLRFSARLFKYSPLIALIFLGPMALERLIVMV
jgi:hypothetical protein